MPGPPRLPTPDLSKAEPLPRGPVARGDSVWYAGAWRSPEGIERYRIRMRLRQRARRVAGTGR